MIRVAVAGVGAFGAKHLDGLATIDEAEVVAVVDPVLEAAQSVAAERGIPSATAELDDVLARDDVDAVILATPTPIHAAQAIACLEAGKHVEVEIPLCDDLADGKAVVEAQRRAGKVAMCGHTRRFNPSHQWVRHRIEAGEYAIQHLDVQTFFFRRTNTNALGQPRSWTDHLLWHHAAHTVDLFQYQTGSPVTEVNAMAGPIDPELGIYLDLSVQLKAESGALCTLALSFNNDGPFGTFFRYIGDTGTYIARYDDLVTGNDEPVDVPGIPRPDGTVSMNGIELQDREFLTAIAEGREPNASVARVLPCYEVLDRIERRLATGGAGAAGA